MEYNIAHRLSRGEYGVPRKSIGGVCKDNKSFIQRLRIEKNLPIHNGCINSLVWNSTGSKILTGSDDHRLVLTDPFTNGYNVLADLKTLHRSNIFCARFLPHTNDTRVVSCSGDGAVMLTDTTRETDSTLSQFNCHDGTCYKLLPIDPHTFMSCGEDKTVRFYDLRHKNRCCCCVKSNDGRHYLEPLIHAPKAVTCLAGHPWRSYEIAIGVADSSVYIHDRRMVQSVMDSPGSGPGPITNHLDRLTISSATNRVTSITYSPDGDNLLASFSSDYIYLFSAQKTKVPPLQLEKHVQTSQEAPTKSRPGKKLKKLRLRGDWTDCGPGARPISVLGQDGNIGQARPTLHTSLMERMTVVLSQMLQTSSVPDDDDGNNSITSPSQSDSGILGNGTGGGGSAGGGGIENELASLRNDFIQRHHIEPAVNLTYRPGESSGLISMSPANELERGGHAMSDEEPFSSVPSSTCDSLDSSGSTGSSSGQEPMQCEPSIPTDMRIIQKYDGNRNSRTVCKESNFWGDNYIISGSDCGHVFFWDRMTGELVNIIEADKHVVNCVQPHPTYPILATSGIDYDVKIMTPSLDEPGYDAVKGLELRRRNAVMLEETRDTITVPATFMIRMLSCLSHIRQGTSRGSPSSSSSSSS